MQIENLHLIVYNGWPKMSHNVVKYMAAVDNSRHNKTAFLTLPFEFGSVAVISFLVAILEISVAYIMTSFIVIYLRNVTKFFLFLLPHVCSKPT